MTFGCSKERPQKKDTAVRSRKLRPLVISMEGSTERQQHIRNLFSSMKDDFEPPVFSPGIPSRTLRNRYDFLRIAHQVGLVPGAEWQAIETATQNGDYQDDAHHLFDCLKDIPIQQRQGSKQDVQLHYSVELWRKAKGLNRGRAVLACFFAHLLAMKTCVEDNFDFILEDNVRAPPEECARRIWETINASRESGNECHLRYYGWLGSLVNLHWVFHTHAPKTEFSRNGNRSDDAVTTVFPFPTVQDFDTAPQDPDTSDKDKPGGTPIWGAYAYWISKEGLDCLLDVLRKDVGAMLWKGKRMRAYVVKPIDKVLPRRILEGLGRTSVHVSSSPAFFRAPMLTSTLHAKWDKEFCKSSEYQLDYTVLSWSDLWLSDMERRIVRHYSNTNEWVTMKELEQLDESEHEDEQ